MRKYRHKNCIVDSPLKLNNEQLDTIVESFALNQGEEMTITCKAVVQEQDILNIIKKKLEDPKFYDKLEKFIDESKTK